MKSQQHAQSLNDSLYGGNRKKRERERGTRVGTGKGKRNERREKRRTSMEKALPLFPSDFYRRTWASNPCKFHESYRAWLIHERERKRERARAPRREIDRILHEWRHVTSITTIVDKERSIHMRRDWIRKIKKEDRPLVPEQQCATGDIYQLEW